MLGAGEEMYFSVLHTHFIAFCNLIGAIDSLGSDKKQCGVQCVTRTFLIKVTPSDS